MRCACIFSYTFTACHKRKYHIQRKYLANFSFSIIFFPLLLTSLKIRKHCKYELIKDKDKNKHQNLKPCGMVAHDDETKLPCF